MSPPRNEFGRESNGDAWRRLPPYVTAQQAADYLQVHVRTVHRYALDGLLTGYHLPRQRAVRFQRAEVEALIVPADRETLEREAEHDENEG